MYTYSYLNIYTYSTYLFKIIFYLKRLTFGRVSLKQKITKRRSEIASPNANKAGITNQSECPACFCAHTANIAPIIGPIMKPMEKAMPTNAWKY